MRREGDKKYSQNFSLSLSLGCQFARRQFTYLPNFFRDIRLDDGACLKNAIYFGEFFVYFHIRSLSAISITHANSWLAIRSPVGFHMANFAVHFALLPSAQCNLFSFMSFAPSRCPNSMNLIWFFLLDSSYPTWATKSQYKRATLIQRKKCMQTIALSKCTWINNSDALWLRRVNPLPLLSFKYH